MKNNSQQKKRLPIYGIKKGELEEALDWFYPDSEKDEIIDHLKNSSSSLNPGKNPFITTSGKEISIELDNNNKLRKIGHIAFYEHLKYRRVLFLWTRISKNDIWNGLKDKSFHQRSFSDIKDFTQYISYIFYAKAFYSTTTLRQGQDIFAHIQSYLNNNSHFKFITIGTESYVVMDSLLIYNYERVFCIFKENKNSQDRRYNLDTICTKEEIIYTENTTTKNLKLENYIKDEKDYPQREIKITDDNTLIRFESDSITIDWKTFWNHIFSDDNHENRIKEIKRIKEITKDTKIITSVKEEIKNSITKTINKEVKLQQKINKRIFPNNAFIYINNKDEDFFPETYRSCFLEFEFGGEMYYLVFKVDDNNDNKKVDDNQNDDISKPKYKFTFEFGGEMYFKIEDNTSNDNQNDDISKPVLKKVEVYTSKDNQNNDISKPVFKKVKVYTSKDNQNDDISKPKYQFTLVTLYTKEMYENRFKME